MISFINNCQCNGCKRERGEICGINGWLCEKWTKELK